VDEGIHDTSFKFAKVGELNIGDVGGQLKKEGSGGRSRLGQ
jgi:hypothetical protein